MAYPAGHELEHLVLGLYHLWFVCVVTVIAIILYILYEFRKRLKEQDHGYERRDGLLFPGWTSGDYSVIAYDDQPVDKLVALVFEMSYRGERASYAFGAAIGAEKFPSDKLDLVHELAEDAWKKVKTGEPREAVARYAEDKIYRLIGEK